MWIGLFTPARNSLLVVTVWLISGEVTCLGWLVKSVWRALTLAIYYKLVPALGGRLSTGLERVQDKAKINRVSKLWGYVQLNGRGTGEARAAVKDVLSAIEGYGEVVRG